jgi:hypothetical protein
VYNNVTGRVDSTCSLKVGRKRLAAAEAWHLSFRSLHLSDMDSGDTIARVNQQVMTRIDVPFALPL